jgi:predicted nucleic acid-binding protein
VIVIDANVAIKWVVEQANFERAREIIERETELIAPGMFVAEITNTLWRYVRMKQISADHARAGIVSILRQVSSIERDANLAAEALALGLELNYAPYDCFYVVLAMRRSAPLVTADRRLVNHLNSTRYSSYVIHLTDWT